MLRLGRNSDTVNGSLLTYLCSHIYNSLRPFWGNTTSLYSHDLVVASTLALVSRSGSRFGLRSGSGLEFQLVVEWKLVPKDGVSLSKCF